MVTHIVVEAFIIDYLRDDVLDLERYEAVQLFPVQEYKDHEEWEFYGNFILEIEPAFCHITGR